MQHEILRHIGKTANTDRRIVVVYMQIPGRPDHALVVDTDGLPPKFHDDLMQVVAGEAQKEVTLGDILGRRILPATGTDMLSSLHQAGYLQPMPVRNVIMLPQPNRGVPLVELLAHMNPGSVPPAPEAPAEDRANRIVENQEIDRNDQKFQIANNIIAEAKMLEEEARRKREQAYALYPALGMQAPIAQSAPAYVAPVAPAPAPYIAPAVLSDFIDPYTAVLNEPTAPVVAAPAAPVYSVDMAQLTLEQARAVIAEHALRTSGNPINTESANDLPVVKKKRKSPTPRVKVL